MKPQSTALLLLCTVSDAFQHVANMRSVTSYVSSPSSRSSPLMAGSVDDLDALLWDMDGVLADTERDAHRPSFNKAFREFGIDDEWSAERYGQLLETGGGKERMTAHWNEVGWPELFDGKSDEEKQGIVKQLHLRKTELFQELIKAGEVPLRPGVARMFQAASDAGKTLAVCSTSSEFAVRTLVETLIQKGSGEPKISIFAGDMVKAKKPAPDVYNLAVDSLGLEKHKCVVIEDSHIGLNAAKAAGLTCIVTKSSYTANEDFTGADSIVEELGENPETYVTLETLAGLLP